MVDVFEEVEEELRAARYTAWIQRGWPYAAAAVVIALLVTLGVWGYGEQQKSQQAKASVTYDQALQALQTGDLEGADRSFAGLAASAPAGYRALALMQRAEVAMRKGKTAEAATLLDQSAKAAPDDILGDAARIKAAQILIDTRPLAEIEARLKPLTEDKRPYHLMAREALAMARLQAGRPQDAQSDLAVISLSQDATEDMRQRAQFAKALIQTGLVASLPEAAKAAPAAIPAPPPVPQAAVPGAVQ